MKVAIHQPNYLPYPGFFVKLFLSDIFVIYDTAQFTRGDFINRNRIRTFSYNGYMWLTLPVGKKNFKDVPINQVKIADKGIFEKHSKTLMAMYSRAPFFDKEMCEIVETPHKNLAEHNIFIIKYIIEKLKLNKPRLILSSNLKIEIRRATEGLIDIVKAVGGKVYISGQGAKTYIQPELFKKENIDLVFIDYKPWRYPQIHPGFVENMSIIDAIMNIGWRCVTKRLKETRVCP